ncbi:hypothetical protein [Mixta intestinalis]|uniref:Uncharacterized protein n=1 Tax=Mixta intestinalis TaxID=1615494 RepID=A0A6P1Q5E6_9GAMM|nr:hypothetical protein [Mixta intestinalis]QHM73297.1 hypothetical protein C7M51_03643 [Mixta intestinalis]
MKELTATEIKSVSGGFYFSAPFIGASIGNAMGDGDTSAILAGAAIASIALVPYCPLHWCLGIILGGAAIIVKIIDCNNPDPEPNPEPTPIG